MKLESRIKKPPLLFVELPASRTRSVNLIKFIFPLSVEESTGGHILIRTDSHYVHETFLRRHLLVQFVAANAFFVLFLTVKDTKGCNQSVSSFASNTARAAAILFVAVWFIHTEELLLSVAFCLMICRGVLQPAWPIKTVNPTRHAHIVGNHCLCLWKSDLFGAAQDKNRCPHICFLHIC